MPTGVFERKDNPIKNLGKYVGIKGKAHPSFGKKRPDVAKRMKENCPMKKEHNKRRMRENNPMSKIRINKGTFKKNDIRLMGENNPAFNNWSSLLPYGKEFNKKLKQFIKDLFFSKCFECGYSEEQLEYKLAIHHIDFDKYNNKIKNLIPLCKSCHTKTLFNREQWIKYYQKKLAGQKCPVRKKGGK